LCRRIEAKGKKVDLFRFFALQRVPQIEAVKDGKPLAETVD